MTLSARCWVHLPPTGRNYNKNCPLLHMTRISLRLSYIVPEVNKSSRDDTFPSYLEFPGFH